MEPTVVLVVGMAGSGKTSFTQRLFSYASSKKMAPFVINLDPAVLDLPFPCDIDIRDTLDYKDVMENARFDLVLKQLASINEQTFADKKTDDDDDIGALCIVDTPGQIEVFTWSASGTIITESISFQHPTVIAYIVDTPRCAQNCATFMSNMLYACSLLYKMRLPLLLVLNKVDEQSDSIIREWMTDFECFHDALRHSTESDSFMTSMIHSMSLVLEEFYSSLHVIGLSSYTGDGFDKFMIALKSARKEYFSGYRKLLEAQKADKLEDERNRVASELAKLRIDLFHEDKQN